MSRFFFEGNSTPETLTEPSRGGSGGRIRTGLGYIDGGEGGGGHFTFPTDQVNPSPEERATRFAGAWTWSVPEGHIHAVKTQYFSKEMTAYSFADFLLYHRGFAAPGESRLEVFQQLDVLTETTRGLFHLTGQMREVIEMIAALAFTRNQVPQNITSMRKLGVDLNSYRYGMFDPHSIEPSTNFELTAYEAFYDLIEQVRKEQPLTELQLRATNDFRSTWRSSYQDKYGKPMPVQRW